MIKNKKTKRKSENQTKKSLTLSIVDTFNNNPTQSFNYKQLSTALGVKTMVGKKMISEILYTLADQDFITEIHLGKFKLIKCTRVITGKVDLALSGNAYIISDDIKDDVFVNIQNLNRAFNGDIVKVELYAQKKERRPEGKVIEILERAKNNFIGIVEIKGKVAFLVIESKQMPYDIFIPLEKLNGAKDGDKAIGKITDWPDRARNPFGEITMVLGKPGDNDTEMHAILAEFDLPIHFPKNVEEEAENIPAEITKEDIDSRRDFRDITTFTIDPVDAKDYDDALSIRKIKDNNWEIGVHIADVTHYIELNTILEEEAYQRATSVYLVDRVVPMLPERLSNGICSLRENEEKLCFSAVFNLSENGEIIKEWFGRTIINSNKRFSYEEAQEVLDNNQGLFFDELNTLNKIAKIMRAERFKDGAIGFDRAETKFDIDITGKPLRVFFKEHGDTNHLIEEFMLLANKRVATFIGKPREDNHKPKTFVYRIHDRPDPKKFEQFTKFINKFGYNIKVSDNPDSINNLLEKVKGSKEQNMIETLAVRTMAKAQYSTNNIGHYGLHFEYYSHFTSPIRRYPDMMVHRLLAQYLNNGKSANADEYEDMCKHSCDMEKRAADAERSSIKYKAVEFMMDRIGEEFEGVISGVTEWGIYVELKDTLIEGMIAIRNLTDDFYIFDEDNYMIVGRRTHRKFQLGDELTIKIAAANLAKKQLDFVIAE